MSAPRIANSLAEANPQDLVHIDAAGRVRTRGRARVYSVLYWGSLATLIGVEAYLGYLLFDLPGLSIAAVLGGYVGWIFGRLRQLQRGIALGAESRLDEAEERLEKVAHGRLVPRRLRARALGGLASIASLRGDPELALSRVREALSIWRRSKRPMAQIARYAEVQLLTRLGKTDEARARLSELGPAPEGEYLRLGHHTIELYLAFVEGEHSLDDAELHERASFALGITSAASLLALLAWAFRRNGDEEMTALLLSEARDRHPGKILAKRMPDLQRWIEDHDALASAPVESPDEVEEALLEYERAEREAKRR